MPDPKRRQSLLAKNISGDSPRDTPDLRRVVELERRPRPVEGSPESEELIDTVTSWYSNGRAAGDGCECVVMQRPCITRLRTVQAWTLLELQTERGVLGSIGTGFGKSLLDILAPLAIPGSRLALLLVPSTLASQLAKQYRHAAQHFRVPSIRIHGANAWQCTAPPIDGRPAPLLHVISYQMLSGSDWSTFIEHLDPDLIICDEVQCVANMSARTRRLLRHFKQNGRTLFAGWSGTITDDSLMDYWRLAILALREKAPVPLAEDVALTWAAAIDPSGWPAPGGALEDELCRDDEHVQEGYHRRLVETAGIIVTAEASCDVELTIEERDETALPVPDAIRRALDEVRRTRLRPDGDPLPDNFSLSRCLRELACGFYLVWYFQRGESDELIARWRARRKAWFSEVRDQCDRNEARLDSQKLCALAAERHHTGYDGELPTFESDAWPDWRDVKDRVKPITRAVWLDRFVVEDAARFALDLRDGPGIVWYDSVCLGTEISRAANLPLHGGGVDAGDRMDAELINGITRSIVASIRSHATGREGLQYKYARQRVTQVPSSGEGWEQLLGRLKRPGQTRAVHAEVAAHTAELRKAFETACGRAVYVQRTIGSPQKLLG